MGKRVMDIEFNAFEVFEIAEQIERNGVSFYRNAAVLFDDPQISNVFTELANWETQHLDVFKGMKKQLSDESRELKTFKPENNMLIDAQAMAGLAVFGIRPDPADGLTGKESVEDIFTRAIEKEKESIVYYTGLKNFVPLQAAQHKINDIIDEEMRHIRILGQSLEQRRELQA